MSTKFNNFLAKISLSIYDVADVLTVFILISNKTKFSFVRHSRLCNDRSTLWKMYRRLVQRISMCQMELLSSTLTVLQIMI